VGPPPSRRKRKLIGRAKERQRKPRPRWRGIDPATHKVTRQYAAQRIAVRATLTTTHSRSVESGTIRRGTPPRLSSNPAHALRQRSSAAG
jgi:hypothetical protein